MVDLEVVEGYLIIMLILTSVSASEVVIGDVADKFKLPCQRVHAVTVTVCRRRDSNRRGFEQNNVR